MSRLRFYVPRGCPVLGILGMLAPHVGRLEGVCTRWPELAARRALYARMRPLDRSLCSQRVKVPAALLEVAQSPWVSYAIRQVVLYGGVFLAEVER